MGDDIWGDKYVFITEIGVMMKIHLDEYVI